MTPWPPEHPPQLTERPGIFSFSYLASASLHGGKTFFPYLWFEKGYLQGLEEAQSSDYQTLWESHQLEYFPTGGNFMGFQCASKLKPEETNSGPSKSDFLRLLGKWEL